MSRDPNPLGGMMGGLMAGLQQNMADMAANAENTEVEGEAGGGLVRIIMTAGMAVKRVHIDPEVVGDQEMLEDLLLVAMNDANAKAREAMTAATMGMMGGLGLPPGLLDGLLPR